MNTDIVEGNTVIDIFMEENGLLGKEYEEHYSDEFWRPTKRKYQPEDLEYHTSWDWLMPVVEKISSLGYFVEIVNAPKYKSCRIYRSDDKIDNCGVIVDEIPFNAICQFVQWYNQQHKPIKQL